MTVCYSFTSSVLRGSDLGITQEVCAMQVSKDLAGVSEKDMADVVIAYEPVWAIG